MTTSRPALYAILDEFIAALAANDSCRVRWATDARYSENNVLMPAGDGAWNTITAIEGYDLRFADPENGQVSLFGVLNESGDRAPFAIRLACLGGEVSEAELVVARPHDAGTPFLSADLTDRPQLNEVLDPVDRTPRARMIELANGYFDTLQQNDGTILTVFDPQCDRRENGVQTTNNPQPNLAPVSALPCEEQFRMGYYRFDNWLRARRFPLVDEERGLVLAGVFIDHDGKLKRYALTDGQEIDAFFRRPHSFNMLELFKIKRGALEAVEAVFHYVPYRMPSPWAADEVDKAARKPVLAQPS